MAVAGSGGDLLVLATALSGGAINLGAGTDRLALADGANSLTVTSAETLTGGAGTDLVTLGAAVSGASITLGAGSDRLVLASGAFLERSGGDWVFVLNADGKTAQRRRVRLGRRNAGQVEVLGGLAAGERVVVSDYTGLEHIDRIHLE